MSESNVPEIIKYLTEDNLKLMYSRLNRRYLVVDALPSVDSLEPADKNVIYLVKETVGETVRYWPNVLDNDVWKPFGIGQADLDGKVDKVDAVEGHLVVADKDGNLVDADIMPGTFVALAFDPDEEIQPHATDIRKVWEAFQSGIQVMLLDNRTNGTGLYASLNAAGYTWPAGDEMAERLTDVDDNYRPYDNSVQGYYFEGKFYDDAAHTTQIEPSDGEVYHDIATDKTYIYGDETFTQVHRFIQFATNELIKDEPAWSSRTSARPVFYRIFEPVGSATANNFDVVYGESTGIIKDDMTKKADKVSNAVQGHFAGLDASGNLTDSGVKASDFATATQGRKADTALQEHQDISGKADKSEMTVTAGDGVAKVQLKAGLSVDVITDISGKQDVIDDLEGIRSGAAAGATAYHKPGSGIPKSDLVSDVQASLSKADTALQEHQDISGKVDKVDGKGLSTEDYTTAEKTKLAGIEDGAQVNTFETIKVNGTALTPDDDKAVNIDLTGYKTVYPSLQDAISDSSNLSVGDIFETNGFYTSGDGGAARYLVSTDLAANDMDIISLGANKQAVLQLESNMVMLEQLGYIPSEDDSNYIEPYINRVLSLPVSTLQLQIGTYFFHTNILIKKKGFTLRGLGSDKTTLKQVSLGLFGLQFEYRELTLDGFTLAGPSDGVGICTRQWSTTDGNVSHYNYTFKNLVVTGFRTGFELGGDVKWQTKFDNVRVSLCYNGISLVESGFCYEFHRVMTDRCENAGLYVFGQVDALFSNCNFGSISSGVRIVPWSYGTIENPYYESTLLFNGCNFELDRAVSPCPGAFVYVSDGLNVNLNFVSCRFTWGPGMQLAGNYGLSLGDQCCIKIDSCEIYVNTANASVTNFFDPSRNPKKKVGSVIISGNSRCSQKSWMPQWSFPEPSFGSKFKPTLINFSKSGIAHYDDNTNFLQNYGGTSNGTMLYNDSDNCLYTFINGTLCKITHQQGGANNTIYIYNKLYTFVKIGKLLWLTENLDIPTENSVPITNYGSGQYYPIDDYESLAEYIPLDWRLPTRAECRDSLDIVEGVSPNAKKCCSTAYPSIWPTATNEYGLSMLPNGSSESVDPTRAFWWTSSKGGSDDKTPVFFGVDDVRGVAFSSYTAKIPIRLVRVAT